MLDMHLGNVPISPVWSTQSTSFLFFRGGHWGSGFWATRSDCCEGVSPKANILQGSLGGLLSAYMWHTEKPHLWSHGPWCLAGRQRDSRLESKVEALGKGGKWTSRVKAAPQRGVQGKKREGIADSSSGTNPGPCEAGGVTARGRERWGGGQGRVNSVCVPHTTGWQGLNLVLGWFSQEYWEMVCLFSRQKDDLDGCAMKMVVS